MCDNPTFHILPSIHSEVYKPMWKALADNNVVISNHIGSGSPAPHASMDTTIDAWIVTMPMAIANSTADWLNLKAVRDYDLDRKSTRLKSSHKCATQLPSSA